MYAYTKCISAQQQKLLLMMMHKENINFSNQNIYKCRRSFNVGMRQLIRCGWVAKNLTRINNHYANEYSLTLEGILITKVALVVFNEHQG